MRKYMVKHIDRGPLKEVLDTEIIEANNVEDVKTILSEMYKSDTSTQFEIKEMKSK